MYMNSSEFYIYIIYIYIVNIFTIFLFVVEPLHFTYYRPQSAAMWINWGKAKQVWSGQLDEV